MWCGEPCTNHRRNTSKKNVLLVYAEGATQRKVTFAPTENKDFSNVIHCSRNVIRCERRSSQCTSTSQFGDPKTEKRKNKRKPRSRCVKELKSARSVLYGGGIARASRFREKHVPQRNRKGRKTKGIGCLCTQARRELKNVARLTDGQQALSDETKLILRPRTELRLSLVSPAKRGNNHIPHQLHRTPKCWRVDTMNLTMEQRVWKFAAGRALDARPTTMRGTGAFPATVV